MPSPNEAFDTSIKSWLKAMKQAGRIKSGGKLVFINRQTGSAVPMRAESQQPNVTEKPTMKVRTDPVAELRQSGMVLGKSKKRKR